MPVQRIARYPMLLQTIQKHTDGQHLAYSRLQETARAAVDINCRINEYKRFREVGECERRMVGIYAARLSKALYS